VVANLSRYVQCAELDLSRFRGQTPVELFGQARFPPIGELPYFLTLGPHAFYWFRLEWGGGEAEPLEVDLPTCRIPGRWDTLFEGLPLTRLLRALPAFMKRHRWFAGKLRAIQQVRLIDVLTVHDVPRTTRDAHAADEPPSNGLPATRILVVRVEYVDGEPELYVLPVVFAQGEQKANILADRPGDGIITVERADGAEPATLCDTTHEGVFWLLLFDTVARGRNIRGKHGTVEPLHLPALTRLQGRRRQPEIVAVAEERKDPPPGIVAVHGGEQAHTSAVLGGKLILKLFRRIDLGVNPELEIGRFLTEDARLACVPQTAGALEYRADDGDLFTMAVLHEYVASECDAWNYTIDELGRYLERIASELSGSPPPETMPCGETLLDLAERVPPASAQDAIGSYLQSAELLGKRTAEMHLALAAGETPNLAPQPFTKLYQRSLYQSMRTQGRKTFNLLGKKAKTLPEKTAELAGELLRSEDKLMAAYRALTQRRIAAQRTRYHGDFHLGQILFTGKDFVIFDFEGDSDLPIGERLIKRSPLRDVAGMLLSFHYASRAVAVGQRRETLLPAGGTQNIAPWLTVWFAWVSAVYLKSYLAEAERGGFLPGHREDLDIMLKAYLLERALEELNYELLARPDTAQTSLEAILMLLARQ